MNVVAQEDELGCGIACIARVLGISYQEALCLFADGKLQANTKGFLCKELTDVLNRRGRRYKHHYVNERFLPNIYKEGTIVFIKRTKNYPHGHFLYRTKEGWMDPWLNLTKDNNRPVFRAGIINDLPERPIYALVEE
jgi:hypothetical protein